MALIMDNETRDRAVQHARDVIDNAWKHRDGDVLEAMETLEVWSSNWIDRERVRLVRDAMCIEAEMRAQMEREERLVRDQMIRFWGHVALFGFALFACYQIGRALMLTWLAYTGAW